MANCCCCMTASCVTCISPSNCLLIMSFFRSNASWVKFIVASASCLIWAIVLSCSSFFFSYSNSANLSWSSVDFWSKAFSSSISFFKSSISWSRILDLISSSEAPELSRSVFMAVRVVAWSSLKRCICSSRCLAMSIILPLCSSSNASTALL